MLSKSKETIKQIVYPAMKIRSVSVLGRYKYPVVIKDSADGPTVSK